MTLPELVRRVKVVTMTQGEESIKKFILDDVIGPDVKGQWIVNQYRRILRRKVKNDL